MRPDEPQQTFKQVFNVVQYRFALLNDHSADFIAIGAVDFSLSRCEFCCAAEDSFGRQLNPRACLRIPHREGRYLSEYLRDGVLECLGFSGIPREIATKIVALLEGFEIMSEGFSAIQKVNLCPDRTAYWRRAFRS